MSNDTHDDAAVTPWTIEDSTELYRIEGWGQGFFHIGSTGHLMVQPGRDPERRIDLLEVVNGLLERGVTAPITIGFPELLEQRMRDMVEAFQSAFAENEYHGTYAPVYPIKVNQHRYLVGQVERIGRELGFGLEVGSKPELLAVMGLTADTPDRLIICNGFKEERYVRHIMLATKLGRQIVGVIENLAELELILEQSKIHEVRPRIGVRLKLESHSTGRWQASTGGKAKFGLDVPGVLQVVERLRAADMLDCLQLLHCHMGSQLSDIRVVNNGVNELTRAYVEMVRIGAGLRFIDVGGGLAVDYDGSRTNWDFSTNYGLREYAATVVYRIMSVCDEAGVPHPSIITEAGRALVSHHSVLVADVLGASRLDRWSTAENDAAAQAHGAALPRVVVDALEASRSILPERILESYHDALQARDEALTLFNVGHLSLEFRSLVDRIFWSTCLAVTKLARDLDEVPEELIELELKLSDTYFCNLSVFQSLPDAWAIDQVFPVMPIQRLDEHPDRKATLADITCDSDGKIDRFVDFVDVAPVLPLHELRDGERYFIAVFLVGAYQETLGDLHNLFGDTNLVHVCFDEENGWAIDEIVEGDTVSEVLGYLQYDPRELLHAIRRDCEASVRAKRLTVAESRALLEAYEAGLNGYTYLE